MITKEEVIDFFKKHSMETTSEIMQEISEEIRKRWEKGAKKDSMTNEELEKMMSATKLPLAPKPPQMGMGLPVEIQTISFTSSQHSFGFPPMMDTKKLSVAKVYYRKQDSKTLYFMEGGIVAGEIGLTVIGEKKAVSLLYSRIESIEWMKNKEGGKKQNDNQGASN